jgi:sialic acid synthase SpsE
VRAATLALGTRQMGDGQPCVVIALVGSAHEGAADAALRMIDAAFKMGADAIEFQIFRADALVVRRHPGRKELDAVEIAPRDWRRILKAARASGLAVLAEVFDPPSLDLAAEALVDALQVHTTDMENPELIRAVAASALPVVLSVGALPDAVVREAIDLTGEKVALLFGSPLSPVPVEAIRFRELLALKERDRVPVGFLDQTDGGSAFALLSPALAAAHGADFVEKRFALDRSRKRRDDTAALSPEDFYRMVELLRQGERARGEPAGGEAPEAERERRAVARSIVAGILIGRGEVLTAPMLAFKRTDGRTAPPGFPPREAHRVIGRRAARPIQVDETIREDMLE